MYLCRCLCWRKFDGNEFRDHPYSKINAEGSMLPTGSSVHVWYSWQSLKVENCFLYTSRIVTDWRHYQTFSPCVFWCTRCEQTAWGTSWNENVTLMSSACWRIFAKKRKICNSTDKSILLNLCLYSNISEARLNLPLTGLYNKRQKSVQSFWTSD